MRKKPKVLLVNGYGCHYEHTPLASIYLPMVVQFCKVWQPDMIIFSGGQTQKKSAPEVSEAGLMKSVVAPQLSYEPVRMCLNTTAFTTLDNVQGASRFIHEWFPGQKTQITIFCEATRALKVNILARHFLIHLVESIDDIRIETASWERADPKKELLATVYDYLAITLPWLGLAERARRFRIRRSEEI